MLGALAADCLNSRRRGAGNKEGTKAASSGYWVPGELPKALAPATPPSPPPNNQAAAEELTRPFAQRDALSLLLARRCPTPHPAGLPLASELGELHMPARQRLPSVSVCPLCLGPLSSSLAAHLAVCNLNTRSCPACKAAVQASELDEHFLACRCNVRECFICKSSVQLSMYVAHVTECGGSRPTRMYHGTTPAAAASILHTRMFEVSDKGLLGIGVYVSRDPRKALRYGPCVLECAVFQGKTISIRERHHPLQKCWHRVKGYDSAYIPPDSYVLTRRGAADEDDDQFDAVGTRGRTGGDLEEHCIADPRRVFPIAETAAHRH